MRILILGKAKTGTTAVAQAIQANLSGAKLIMEPESPDDLVRQLQANRMNSVTKVIYEHWNLLPESRDALIQNELIDFDKIIFTLRDPRDEILSRLIYFIFPWSLKHPRDNEKIQAWLALIKQKEQDPSSLSLIDLTSRCDEIFGGSFISEFHFIDDYSNFIDQRPDGTHLLRYEDFILGDLVALEKYLEFRLEKKAVNRKYRYTMRTASHNNWKRFLLPEDVEFIRSNFGEQIERLGYTDWSLETPSSLPAEHYSGYIEKLLSTPVRPAWMRRLSRT